MSYRTPGWPAAIRPAGDAALLIDAPGTAGRLAAAVEAARLPGVIDVVPGAVSVLVTTQPGRRDLTELARQVAALPLPDAAAAQAGEVDIPVVYDGPDLAGVAELTGLDVPEVIARHLAGRYRVGWMGFAPGFGYLTGLDDVLAAVPRLPTPRQSVPAGSVAVAGGLAAVYPRSSPGGWRLLGRTTARMWDLRRDPPALLTPGTVVRFRPAEPRPAKPRTPSPRPAAPRPPEPPAAEPSPGGPRAGSHDGGGPAATGWAGPVEVLRPGPLATVQDLGRPGYAHLGVPRSGAADAESLRVANRLAGNPDGAAAVELTLGRAQLRFHEPAVVALAGAELTATVTPGAGETGETPAAHPVGFRTAFEVAAGAVLRLGAPPGGLRTYLAVRGGIDVPAELGSRSADVLSGLGPRPLQAGDRLPVGLPADLPATLSPGPAAPGAATPGATAPVATAPRAATPGAIAQGVAGPGVAAPGAVPGGPGWVTLRVVAGPRLDWFTAGALEALVSGEYRVTPASNRTGLRLTGPALDRSRPGELPSEGMVPGALEVPPDGQPILLLADVPTTGGYPVLAVVHSQDVSRAGQLRPGARVRFRVMPQP